MNLKEITDKIQEKLGTEESAKISDDIANILVFDESNSKSLKAKDEEITRLGKDKDMLIQANGNLLLHVPQKREEKEDKEEEKYKPFDYRTIFDEKGNLKR